MKTCHHVVQGAQLARANYLVCCTTGSSVTTLPYRPGRNEGTQDKFETLSTAPLNGRKAWGKGSLSVSRAVEVCHSAVLGEVLCQLGLQKVRTVHLRQATLAGELRHEHRGMTPQCLHGWGQHQALEQHDGRPSSAGWRGDGTRLGCLHWKILGKRGRTHNLNLPPRSLSAFIALAHAPPRTPSRAVCADAQGM